MFSDASPRSVVSGHAFQAFPALDAAPVGTGQHDGLVSWYSEIHHSTVTPSLNSEHFQVYKQTKSPSQPCLPSLQCVQTSDIISVDPWELVCPGILQINKSPHNDLGWFLLCTAQLHLLQSRVFKRGLISPPLGRIWNVENYLTFKNNSLAFT